MNPHETPVRRRFRRRSHPLAELIVLIADNRFVGLRQRCEPRGYLGERRDVEVNQQEIAGRHDLLEKPDGNLPRPPSSAAETKRPGRGPLGETDELGHALMGFKDR